MKTYDDVADIMDEVFNACHELRKAGQKEYAGGEDTLGNFNRLSKELGISPASVLWVYAMKHKDGIAAHIRGHKSQREDVRGRIKDLIVYLILLHAILDEEDEIGKIKIEHRPTSSEINKILNPNEYVPLKNFMGISGDQSINSK